MEIHKNAEGDRLTMRVCGRLETASAPQFDAEVRALDAGIRNLSIDFSELEYVSSAGLRSVLLAQKAGIAAARAGIKGREIDLAARAVIDAAGYLEYFGHSFGHSLGLEIHEAPNCSPANLLPLPAGAVISAEPGIYLPGELGVRIEDLVLITETGCEVLSSSAEK